MFEFWQTFVLLLNHHPVIGWATVNANKNGGLEVGDGYKSNTKVLLNLLIKFITLQGETVQGVYTATAEFQHLLS